MFTKLSSIYIYILEKVTLVDKIYTVAQVDKTCNKSMSLVR